eukprot:UN0244
MNRLIASSFTLESARFGGYYLHGRGLIGTQMRIASNPDQSGDFNLSLWQVPGTVSGGAKRYIIVHHLEPPTLLEVRFNPMPGGSNWKVTQQKVPQVVTMQTIYTPDYLFWAVCKTNSHVRLGVTGRYWMYVHRWSWLVYGWDSRGWFSGTPDVRAEWIAHPSLMAALDPCEVRRAASDIASAVLNSVCR